MADLTAQRTLVKSPPELWTELSEVESLAKHLGELGEIRIVKVEPESTVAWEGDDVCGTVELEQSGWGTKVTFKATVPEPGPAAEPEPAIVEPDPEPVAVRPDPEPVAVRPDPEPVAVGPDPEAVGGPDLEPAADEPAPVAVEPQSATGEPDSEPDAPKRQGFFARWLFRQREPAPEPEPVVEPEPMAVEPEPEAAEPESVAAEPEPVVVEPAPEPVAVERKPEPDVEPEPEPASNADADRVQRVLDGTLEALGQAHHRPFSRG